MKTTTKLFITIFVCYIWFISNYGGNWMADSVLAGGMSLIDEGDFIIDDYLKIRDGELVIQDNVFYKGHYYPGFPPGLIFIGSFIYLFFKPLISLLVPFIEDFLIHYTPNQIKLILLNIIVTILVSSSLSALTCVLIYKLSKNFIKSKSLRILLALFFAFGTIFFIYSTHYSKKTLSTCFLFFCFYILFNLKHKKLQKDYYYFIAGLLGSFAFMIDYLQIFILVPLGIYALSFNLSKENWKKIIKFIIGCSIPILFILLYQYLIFDNPFSTPYHHFVIEGTNLKDNLLGVSFMGFEFPTIEKIWAITFGSYVGLFFYMPILICSIIGLIFGLIKTKFKQECLLILSIFLILFIFTVTTWFSSVGMGCGFGPRYLIGILPFMILPIGFIFNYLKGLIFILGGFSILNNLLPVFYNYNLLWTGACIKNRLISHYYPLLFKKGLTNYTMNLINYKLVPLSPLFTSVVSISFFVLFGIFMYWLWKR